MALPVVNEDYELGCVDSTQADVDLSGLSDACFTPVYSSSVKANGKKTLTSLAIAVTAATGVITTSLIDGETVTFVSATGTINGTSEKSLTGQQSFCLADDIENPVTYIGKGSMGTLTVIGTNTQSGVTVTDECTVWFKEAGQDKVIME